MQVTGVNERRAERGATPADGGRAVGVGGTEQTTRRPTRRQRSLRLWEEAMEPYVPFQQSPGILARVIHSHLKQRFERLGRQLEGRWFHGDGSTETLNPVFWLATRLVRPEATTDPAAREMDVAAEWAHDHWEEVLRGDYDEWEGEGQPWDGEGGTPVMIGMGFDATLGFPGEGWPTRQEMQRHVLDRHGRMQRIRQWADEVAAMAREDYESRGDDEERNRRQERQRLRQQEREQQVARRRRRRKRHDTGVAHGAQHHLTRKERRRLRTQGAMQPQAHAGARASARTATEQGSGPDQGDKRANTTTDSGEGRRRGRQSREADGKMFDATKGFPGEGPGWWQAVLLAWGLAVGVRTTVEQTVVQDDFWSESCLPRHRTGREDLGSMAERVIWCLVWAGRMTVGAGLKVVGTVARAAVRWRWLLVLWYISSQCIGVAAGTGEDVDMADGWSTGAAGVAFGLCALGRRAVDRMWWPPVEDQRRWRPFPCDHGQTGWCWECPHDEQAEALRKATLAQPFQWSNWSSFVEKWGLGQRQFTERLAEREGVRELVKLASEARAVRAVPAPVLRLMRSKRGKRNARQLQSLDEAARRDGLTPVYIDGGEVKRTGSRGDGRRGQEQAACTFGVYYPHDVRRSFYGRPPDGEYRRATSQLGEVYALLTALAMRRPGERLWIVMDSRANFDMWNGGLEQWGRNGFKKKYEHKAEYLMLFICKAISEQAGDRFQWTASHKGCAGNEAADKVCDKAAHIGQRPARMVHTATLEEVACMLLEAGTAQDGMTGAKCHEWRRDSTRYAAMRSVGVGRAAWARYRDEVRSYLEALGPRQEFMRRREGEEDQVWLDRIANAILDAMWAGAKHVGVVDRWASPEDAVKREQRDLLDRRQKLNKAVSAFQAAVRRAEETDRQQVDSAGLRRRLDKAFFHVQPPSRQEPLQAVAESLGIEAELLQEDVEWYRTTVAERQENKAIRRRFALFYQGKYKQLLGGLVGALKGRKCEVPGMVRKEHFGNEYENHPAEHCQPRINLWKAWDVLLPEVGDEWYHTIRQPYTPELVRAEMVKKKPAAAPDPDGIAPAHIVHGGEVLHEWVADLLNVWRFEVIDIGPSTTRHADLRLIDKGKDNVPLDRLKKGTWREIMFTSLFRRLAGVVYKPILKAMRMSGTWPHEQQGTVGGARINVLKVKWAIQLAHKFKWPLMIVFTDEDGAFPHSTAEELDQWLQATGLDEETRRFKVGLQRGWCFRVETGEREWSTWMQMFRGQIQGLPDSPFDYMGPSTWRSWALRKEGVGFRVSSDILIHGGVYVDDEFLIFGGWGHTAASTLALAQRGVEIVNTHYVANRRGVSADSDKVAAVGLAWTDRGEYRFPEEWDRRLQFATAPGGEDGDQVGEVDVRVRHRLDAFKLLGHMISADGVTSASRLLELQALQRVLQALEIDDSTLPPRATVEALDSVGQGLAKYHAGTVDPCNIFDAYVDGLMRKAVKKAHGLKPSTASAQIYARCEDYGLGKQSAYELKQWGKVLTLLEMSNDIHMGPLVEYMREVERAAKDIPVCHATAAQSFFDWDVSQMRHQKGGLQRAMRKHKNQFSDFGEMLRIVTEAGLGVKRQRTAKGEYWVLFVTEAAPFVVAPGQEWMCTGTASPKKARLILKAVFEQQWASTLRQTKTNMLAGVLSLLPKPTNAWRTDKSWPRRFSTFAVKAISDNLWTPAWKARVFKDVEAECPLCSWPWCDTRHVMSRCDMLRDRHSVYSHRHNLVLHTLVEELEAAMQFEVKSVDETVNPELLPKHMWSSHHTKPDVVLMDQSRRIVWILDVTIPWDSAHAQARERKDDVYRWMQEPMAAHLNATATTGVPWSVEVHTVVIGALGGVPAATSDLLFELFPQMRIRRRSALLARMSKAALEGSHTVWAVFNAARTGTLGKRRRKELLGRGRARARLGRG